MFEWGENYLSTGIYIFVLLFAALVITICFGPGPGKTFLTAEEKEKKKTQEGLTIVPPAQLAQSIQQQAATASAAAAASKANVPPAPSFPAPTATPAQTQSQTSTPSSTTNVPASTYFKPPSTTTPSAPTTTAATAPSSSYTPTEVSNIELPEKLKANMAQYIETVGQMKTELKKLQKVELLLIAKEIKELIDEMNNTENELNKLIQ